MNTPDQEPATVWRKGVEHACKDFTARIAALGFVRTKKSLWIRKNSDTVEFVHLHRSGSSYGAPLNNSVGFRVHLGIRVLNDDFEALALNGPNSDSGEFIGFRYHLRFNARSGSTYDRCVEDLGRFVMEQGEPWFSRLRSPEALLTRPDSPLKEKSKLRLKAGIESGLEMPVVKSSLKLLGIKN